ncbi:MAG TPA: class I SAM-dependent rRNA methyltransferase [Candidatus Nanopusillus sp.]|nr:class I SAM-dependent rRNA methyltransferase [Candidatus Nanopusillus sp.]HIP90058.1 class I SAM-dependent rRNA methyltransferase [Candidatus Nanopusillus sp.]
MTEYEIKVSKRIRNKIFGGKQVFTINEVQKREYPVGSLVKLVCGNKFVAWATINPKNPKHYIRILSTEKDYDLYSDIVNKLKIAQRYRDKIGYSRHYRWVYSESDFLSGLIVDKFENIIVIQNTNPYFDKNINIIKEAILDVGKNVETIYEKSVGKNREKEWLPPKERILYGSKTRTTIKEGGKKFIVDVKSGQKTGWFLDQRENRSIVKKFVYGKTLDAFSYTGSFGIISSDKADELWFLEKNRSSVEVLIENLKINGIDNAKVLNTNAYLVLKKFSAENRKFDVVILDPPDLLSENYKKGIRSFILVNSMAIDLIKDGYLISFSCSQDLKEDKMFSILRTLIRRKSRRFELISRLHQAFDHKVIFPHKELEYLKGFVLHIW